MTEAPLIAHLIYRLDVGGLENGLVNLIGGLPRVHYRHAVICLDGFTDYRRRLRDDCQVYSLDKRPGIDPASHLRLWRLLRRIRPQLVHTRNLPTLEYTVVAAAAGVRHIIHGEHGRDVHDLDGLSRKYQILRRLCDRFIDEYIALSCDLRNWMVQEVGIDPARIHQIYNGVDSERFVPRQEERDQRRAIFPSGFVPADGIVIGAIGRLQAVKDHANLLRAFACLLERSPELKSRARLAIAGGGPLHGELLTLAADLGIRELLWMPGNRDDVVRFYHALDIFVLPSLREGISNTLLEAMACGLPVVATAVGGNPELVEADRTGLLVPEADPARLADALLRYVENPGLMSEHGAAGRLRAESRFSMAAMIKAYQSVYDRLLHSEDR